MENKAQILDRAQSNSTEFNSSFWMFERHVNIGCLHRWIIHRFMCTSLSLTTDCPKLLPLATSVLGLCPFDFSHERKLCPGRVSMIFLASSRPKSSTLPCGYSESLYRHSQASWSGQVRDGQLKRTPGNIKHVQAKSVTILTAFAQKNAASKPIFILCLFPDHETHSGF